MRRVFGAQQATITHTNAGMGLLLQLVLNFLDLMLQCSDTPTQPFIRSRNVRSQADYAGVNLSWSNATHRHK
jgi:hypothetical protein